MTLLRSLAAALIVGACAAPAALATDAAGLFISAPREVFPLLEPNDRMDMTDYYRSSLATPTANRLGGKSSIVSMTPSQITVRVTPSSSAQIALFKAGNDTVVALVTTVDTPAPDSQVSFYTTAWKPLECGRYLNVPGWKEWTMPGASETDVTPFTPFMLASWVADPDHGTLTATDNLQQFLDADTWQIVSPSLRSSLTYVWNGRRFELLKE